MYFYYLLMFLQSITITISFPLRRHSYNRDIVPGKVFDMYLNDAVVKLIATSQDQYNIDIIDSTKH